MFRRFRIIPSSFALLAPVSSTTTTTTSTNQQQQQIREKSNGKFFSKKATVSPSKKEKTKSSTTKSKKKVAINEGKEEVTSTSKIGSATSTTMKPKFGSKDWSKTPVAFDNKKIAPASSKSRFVKAGTQHQVKQEEVKAVETKQRHQQKETFFEKKQDDLHENDEALSHQKQQSRHHLLFEIQNEAVIKRLNDNVAKNESIKIQATDIEKVSSFRREIFVAESLYKTQNIELSFPSFSLLNIEAAKYKAKFRAALADIILSSSSEIDTSSRINQLLLVRLLCSPKSAADQQTNAKEPFVFSSWFDILMNEKSKFFCDEQKSKTKDWSKLRLTLAKEKEDDGNKWTCTFENVENSFAPISHQSSSPIDAVLQLTKKVHSECFPVNEEPSSFLHFSMNKQNNNFVLRMNIAHNNPRQFVSETFYYFFGNVHSIQMDSFRSPKPLELPKNDNNNKNHTAAFYWLSLFGLQLNFLEPGSAREKLNSISALTSQSVRLVNLPFALVSNIVGNTYNNNNNPSSSSIPLAGEHFFPLGVSASNNKKLSEKSALLSVVRFHFPSLLVNDESSSSSDALTQFSITTNQTLTGEHDVVIDSGSPKLEEQMRKVLSKIHQHSSNYHVGELYEKVFDGRSISFGNEKTKNNVDGDTQGHTKQQQEVKKRSQVADNKQKEKPKSEVARPSSKSSSSPTIITTTTFSEVPHENYILETPTSTCLLPTLRKRVNLLLSEQMEDDVDDFVIEEKFVVVSSSKNENEEEAEEGKSSSSTSSRVECILNVKVDGTVKKQLAIGSSSFSCEVIALLRAYQNALNDLSNTSSSSSEQTSSSSSTALPPNIGRQPLHLQLLIKNIVHYLFGMTLQLQHQTSSSFESTSTTDVETTVRAVIQSADSTFHVASYSSIEYGYEEVKRRCLKSLLARLSEELSSTNSASFLSSLVVLEKGETQIVFPVLPPSSLQLHQNQLAKTSPSFDIFSSVRSFLTSSSASPFWTIAFRTVYSGWKLSSSDLDRVDKFSARCIFSAVEEKSKTFEHKTSILAPIMKSLLSSSSISSSRDDDNDNNNQLLSFMNRKIKPSIINKINQLLNSLDQNHLGNLSSLAQRLTGKILGLRLVQTIEELKLPGTNNILWYVRIYLDTSQTQEMTAGDLAGNILNLGKEAVDDLMIFEEGSSSSSSSSSGNNTSSKIESGENETHHGHHVAWLSSSGPFSAQTSLCMTKYNKNNLVLMKTKHHVHYADPSRFVFTGCASRDFSKKLAETKAIVRFLCANFSSSVLSEVFECNNNSNNNFDNDGQHQDISDTDISISNNLIDLLETHKPEMYHAVSTTNVHDEFEVVTSEVSLMMTTKKNERMSRDLERERRAELRKERRGDRDSNNNNTSLSRHQSKTIVREWDDNNNNIEGGGDELFGDDSNLDAEGKSNDKKKKFYENRKPIIHHHSLSQKKQDEARMMKRFKKGSSFDRFEQDYFGTPSVHAQTHASSSITEHDFTSDSAESSNGDIASSSAKTAKQQHQVIIDATPLKNVLRSALREDRDHELRVKERRWGQGTTVTISMIPRNEEDGTLDLTNEVELGSETEVNSQKALAMVCYKVLQEKFPEKLISAVAEDSTLLDPVLG